MAHRWSRKKTVQLLMAVGGASVAVLAAGDEPDPPPDEPDRPAYSAGPISLTEKLLHRGYGYAFGIAAADLDGDGDLDLTSADATRGTLNWFENDGAGGFQLHHIQEDESGWLERHVTGDVNGDGRPDVVIVKNKSNSILWFENSGEPRGPGLWPRHVVTQHGLPSAYDVALADFDADGDLDVAASSWIRGNQLCWFENSGRQLLGSEWRKHLVADSLSETRTIAVGDFNGDGKPDLLGTATLAPLIAWYENRGTSWLQHQIDNHSAAPIHGHPVDLDGDGDIDVVMALGMTVTSAATEQHHVAWYENVGAPGFGETWNEHLVGALAGGFEAIAVNLDGDADLDIVATSYLGMVVWFENTGSHDHPWLMHLVKDGWARANQIIGADFTGDGLPDLAATAELGSNELRFWVNNGSIRVDPSSAQWLSR